MKLPASELTATNPAAFIPSAPETVALREAAVVEVLPPFAGG